MKLFRTTVGTRRRSRYDIPPIYIQIPKLRHNNRPTPNSWLSRNPINSRASSLFALSTRALLRAPEIPISRIYRARKFLRAGWMAVGTCFVSRYFENVSWSRTREFFVESTRRQSMSYFTRKAWTRKKEKGGATGAFLHSYHAQRINSFHGSDVDQWRDVLYKSSPIRFVTRGTYSPSPPLFSNLSARDK